MGEPARFMLYTHNSDSPLIRNLKLISPSQQVFATRSDNMLTFKIITVASNISEVSGSLLIFLSFLILSFFHYLNLFYS